jgi:hypothetical protein
MQDGDTGRAERHASRLRESSQKLWRWVGSTKQALTELLRGRAQDALSYLRECEKCYVDSDGIANISRRLIARLHLELGDAHMALEVIERTGMTSDEDLYWWARCQTRLNPPAVSKAEEYIGDATRDGLALAKAFRVHVESELPRARLEREGRARLLEDALRHSAGELDVVFPRSSVAFDLASIRYEGGDVRGAFELFRNIASDHSGRSTWPLPHVRALERYGRLGLEHELQECPLNEAETALADYLALWEHADIDRDRAREARDLLSW